MAFPQLEVEEMLDGLLATMKRLRRDAKGNTLAVFGLSLIPLIGAVGLGVDATQWILWKRQLHSAADLGALAGARALADGHTVNNAVRRSLAHNDLRNFTIKEINNAPTSGPHTGNDQAVQVVLTTQEKLPFSGLFMDAAPVIQISAIAENAVTVPNCVITLDTASTGIEIVGSSRVQMNCGLASNSNFDATTSDLIDAGALSAVGTVNTGGGITSDTKVNDGITSVADPYAGKLPTPNAQSSCSPNSWPLIKGNTTINPATGRCFAGLQIQGGTTTLLPGTYLIGEKGISIAAGATLKGDGVTIIFTSTASTFNDRKIGTFSIAGGATVQLSAPTTGTYKGVIIYQDPRTPDKSTNNLNVTGNSDSYFEGAIYAPSVGVKFTGNSDLGMSAACMQIVAKYAFFEGNTDVTNNCPSGSGAAAYGGGGTVRLIA
uniref:pilus assembly protein TadG-related protein n=1 Tax=Parerythrobacter lutipelagi TaxID=1964208 RepID=UPI0010F7C68A|nr:pilus assembly protein TadG-related protein [Parerythrobacter lutipelagi]